MRGMRFGPMRLSDVREDVPCLGTVSPQNSNNRTLPGIALMLLVGSIYLLTFTGAHISNDEVFLFDSTESLARDGNFDRTLTFDLIPIAGATSNQEPLHAIAALPLYAAANSVDGIGLVHAAWMLNVIVTLATVMLLYWGGLSLGYDWIVSGSAALLYGLATFAFSFSTTFFREPLTAFFSLVVVLATLSLFNVGTKGHRVVLPVVWMLVGTFGIALTKASGLLILMLVAILLLPTRRWFQSLPKNPQRALPMIGVVLTGLALYGLFNALSGSGFQSRYSPETILNTLTGIDGRLMLQSVIGYQISPGRSIWLYSPALLLAVWGLWIERRASSRRLLIGIALSIPTMSLAFAMIHDDLWWGGNGWGPRYFVPLLPIMALGFFPAVAALRTRSRRTQRFAAVLVIISVSVQLLGMLVDVWDYYLLLVANRILPWEHGLWTVEWSPIWRHITLLDLTNPNVALARTDSIAPLFVIALLLAVGLAGAYLIWRSIQGKKTVPLVSGFLAGVILIVSTGFLLHSIYDDPRYASRDGEIMALQEQLAQVTGDDDVILLQNAENKRVFMNYFKSLATVYPLPIDPGEVHNPDLPATVVSDNLVDLAGASTINLINHELYAEDHDELWLVMPYGPFNTFTIRPTERFMAENHFPVEEIEVSQRARAIRFFRADPGKAAWESEESYIFDDFLALNAVFLHDGAAYQPGAVIPISLHWMPLEDIPVDYIVSVQISSLNTLTPLAQRDTLPQGRFGNMTAWEIDATYRDNHGLQLPDAISPGEYCLNVIVYDWQTGERLTIFNSAGEAVGDVLCASQITVTS